MAALPNMEDVYRGRSCVR